MAKAAKKSKPKKIPSFFKFQKILKPWIKKYDKYFAGCLAIIVTTFIFMIVLILKEKNFEKPETHVEDPKNKNNLMLFNQPEKAICKTSSCEVSCENSRSFTEFLSSLITLKTDCPNILVTLKLVNINFEDNVKKGWLKDITPPVKSLSINSELLNDIKPKAFSGHPFSKLSTLEILNSNILYLRRDMFIGSAIVDFSFALNYKGSRINVEKNVFGAIADTLANLRFTKSIYDAKVLHNITGKNVDETLLSLEIFDLSDNSLTGIEEYSFNKTVLLTSLYIRDNGLKSIDRLAFRGLDKLKLLSMTSNDISVLYEGVFQHFNKDAKIYIDENKFDCNCNMVWFRDYFTQHVNDYFAETKFKCFYQENEDYKNVHFCDDPFEPVTTTTKKEIISTTSISIPITSPTPTKNLKEIECKQAVSSSSVEFDSKEFSHQDFITDGILTFKRLHYKEDFFYEIVLDEIKHENYHLIVSNEGSLNCLTDLKSDIILQNLSYGTPYTFCFLKKEETKTKIDDCVSFKTQLQWKDQAFLKNKHKAAVITSAVCSMIFTIALTCTSVFYIVRQNPKLIKANKRVIMVEKSKFDALLMPKEVRSSNITELTRMKRNHRNVTPPLPPNHPCRE